MILSPEATIRRHAGSGAWTRETLDVMFRRALARTPGAVAFRDAGEAATPGVGGAALTFAEAERRIEALAAFFGGIGLKPDMVIGVHLPPSADAAVVVMAALRAGLILCPLPLHLGRAEMMDAIAAANIRAIVTASTVEGETTGELVRDVAAEAFAIRFVFALGQEVPDGLIDLAEVFGDPDQFGPAPAVARRGEAADHVALLALARSEDCRPVATPLSHNHIVAAAAAHRLDGRIEPGERLLSTMHPAGLAGLAGGLATALLDGAPLAFHHPTTLAGLAAAVEEAGASRVLMPAAVAAEADRLLPPDIRLSLVSSGLDPRGAPDVSPGRPAVDLLTMGGRCLLPTGARVHGVASLVPAGGGRAETPGAPAPFETALKMRLRPGERRPVSGTGELTLSGPLVPDAPWPEPMSGGVAAGLAFGADGALKPGILAQPTADGRELRLRGPIGEVMVVAGQPVSMDRLDGILSRHPALADAAVFPVDAEMAGTRVGVAVVARPGESIDADGLAAFLEESGGGRLDRPALVRPVREIPRTPDGAVMRQALFLSAVA